MVTENEPEMEDRLFVKNFGILFVRFIRSCFGSSYLTKAAATRPPPMGPTQYTQWYTQ